MQLTPGTGKQTLSETILIAIFVLTLTAKIQLNSIAIGLLLIWWLVSGRYKLSFTILKNSKIFIALSAYYMAHVLSMIYSTNWSYGMATLETKISLLAVPVLLSGIRWDRKLRNIVLWLYIATVLATSLFSLVSTLIYYQIDLSDLSYFSWVLPMTVDLPPNYYSLFVVFALVILIFGTLEGDPKFSKSLAVPMAIYLLIFLALLSSRASFLAFFLIVLIYFGRQVFGTTGQARRRGIMAILVTCSIAVILAASVPYLKDRISQMARGVQYDPRYPVFKTCLEIIWDYPVFGVGIGDVQDVLKERYQENNFQEAFINNYNPHNDLLQIQVTTGIVGTIIYLFLIVQILKRAWTKRNIFMISFTVLYLITSLTESVLERNKGVIFFAFFISIVFILDLLTPTNAMRLQNSKD